MTAVRIVTIGGSAGAIEPLGQLVQGLPRSFSVPVFVVVHIAPSSPSVLPEILARVTPLAVAHAKDGEPISAGRIYVAPPDHHMLVRGGRVRLTRGPRENRHRPSLDTLFHSAAHEYGAATAGVVLSGSLDDGAAGLFGISRAGGVAIIQSPEDASYPGMPSAALRVVPQAHVLNPTRMGAFLARIAEMDETVSSHKQPGKAPLIPDEDRIAELDFYAAQETQANGVPSPFVCPDCGGTLFELAEGALVRYRCRTGHAHSQESLSGPSKNGSRRPSGQRCAPSTSTPIYRAGQPAGLGPGTCHWPLIVTNNPRDDDERAKMLRRVLSAEEPMVQMHGPPGSRGPPAPGTSRD
ncbi:MAG: chemotaxis protein CheB [Myxococcota bacterium]|nr:chemotaxis protein CheB [Myxococcota bacterium]